MTDDDATQVHAAVHAYLAAMIAAQPLDLWNDAQVDALVAHVRERVPWLPAGRGGDTAVVICAVGPGSFDGQRLRGAASPPSGALCTQMGVIVDALPAWVRAADAALAYGCGAWRPVVEGAVGWDSRWDGTLSELRRGPIRSGVRQADAWLREGATVRGYPRRDKRDLDEEAWLLTMMFVRAETAMAVAGRAAIVAGRAAESGEVSVALRTADETGESVDVATTVLRPGAKCVWTVTDRPAAAMSLTEKLIVAARDDVLQIEAPAQRGGELARWSYETDTVAEVVILPHAAEVRIWECGCGNTRCDARHRLAAWPPPEGQIGLSNFVVSAVKGPDTKLAHGVFVTGMYFPLLARPGWAWRLREAPVEFKECAQGHAYEGDACGCGETFDDTRHRRILPKPMLILVDGDPYIYDRQVRCACAQCGNLYGLARAALEGHLRCAACHEPLRLLMVTDAITDDSLFAMCRRIEQLRASVPACVRCHHAVEPVAWCPICRATKLPARPTYVWVRTLATEFSLDAPRPRQDD